MNGQYESETPCQNHPCNHPSASNPLNTAGCMAYQWEIQIMVLQISPQTCPDCLQNMLLFDDPSRKWVKQLIKRIKMRNLSGPPEYDFENAKSTSISVASIGIDTPNCLGHSARVIQQPFSRRKVQRKRRCPMSSSTVTWFFLKRSQTTEFSLEDFRIGMLKTTTYSCSDTQHKMHVFTSVVFSWPLIISDIVLKC